MPAPSTTIRPARSEAEALAYIIDLIYERCRIRLHEGKNQLIRSRLGKRMRYHGIATLEDYCRYLQESGDEEELTHVVDALTTNFTNFLREEDHFKFMVQTALPAVLGPGQKSFQVWSAASATGEEPYSIAFYLAEHFPLELGWDWRIHATDISTKALGKARTAVYPLERAATVPRAWMKRCCQRGVGEYEGQFRIKPAIAGRVEFRQLNLLSQFSFTRPFELIYCRNVMIYFDRPTQEQLVTALARCVVPRGYLLIGHSESLNGLKVPFQCEKPSIYRSI